MKKKIIVLALAVIGFSLNSSAQFGKLKGMLPKKDTTKTESPKESGGKTSGGFMNKVVGKMAKVAGAVGGGMMGMIKTIPDFNGIALTAGYLTNLHPAEVNSIDQTFFEGYEPGGNVLFLMFSSKEDLKFTKVGGTVTVDGKPANYVSMGIYSAYFKDNDKPRLVEAKTSSGQYTSFTVNPPKQKVKVLAINGQKDNISVDLTKDMTIDLGDLDKNDKSMISVQLTGSTLGIKTFYTVGYFQPSSKITIPAAFFRNMDGSNANFTDNPYIQVSRMAEESVSDLKGDLSEVIYSPGTTDGRFIKVTNKPVFNKEIEIVGKGKGGIELPFTIQKPLALTSPNTSRLKKVAITSLSIQGKTTFYNSKTTDNMDGSRTISTVSIKFPVFPEEVWASVLSNMYEGLTKIIKEELNVEIVPIDKVTSSNGYKIIAPFSKEEQNSKTEYVQTYKNTKLLSGIRPLTLMMGKRSGEYKIMEETGANATMRLNLGLTMVPDGKMNAVMVPSLSFDLSGEILADIVNTKYFGGVITGSGTGLSNKKGVNQQILEDTYLQKAAMLNSFRKAIQELQAKEAQTSDYEIEWKAMTK
ncbi:hypothetical protein [Pedobacter arcticus]|uniref:hypothetical protein n=1 Tax=Pedobacter arcticus TaxID=752140 RepID=UPI0002D5FEB6|nr:hypothetical protein [Pedobacter arcticus]